MQHAPTLQDLHALLDRCMAADRPRLAGRMRSLPHASQQTPGREPGRTDSLDRLTADLQRSAARRDERERHLPRPQFPSDLPVVREKDRITAAIRDHQVVVVCGATGSGKTTQLPKICLELGRGVAGMIGHTQPRRIAARSVAARVAHELGTALGNAVGYKVRFTDAVSSRTYVKLMTDGILLAETQGDRDLRQYDTLIIDEAHERSLNIDFLLGYIKQLLPRRPDLKVIITSATIDPESFARHFATGGVPAPIITAEGRTYPVEVRYRPPFGDEEGGTGELTPMEDAVVAAVDELRRDPGPGGAGDVLVFLPGEREIRETADALRHRKLPNTEIVPLFARLSSEEQNRVFEPHAARRVVLATNVAETSLTVPGITHVVDTGVARISRYSPRIKVQRLPVEPVSKASANQRAGRCGRLAPGVCVRLYAEDDFAARPDFTDPEILRTNLASVILQMMALRLGAIEDFPFLQPPDRSAIRDGYDTLFELGAIDERNRITETGRKLARLPVDPRLGRMLLEAQRERCLSEVLVIAAALSVQDPRDRPVDKQDAADEAHAQFRDETSDFLTLLQIWRAFRRFSRQDGVGQSKQRRWCKERFLSFVRLREWQDVHEQLAEIAGEIGLTVGRASRPPLGAPRVGGRGSPRAPATDPAGGTPAPPKHAHPDQIHRALLSGLLSNVGRKGEAKGDFEYDGTRALKFRIFPGSALFQSKPKWIMAAELVRTTNLYARTCARVQPQWIERLAQHLVKRTHADPFWAAETAQVCAYETVTLHGLELVKRRRVDYGAIDPATSRTLFIHHALVNGEYLTNAQFFEHNHDLQRRVRALEDKTRDRDLLADASFRFAFYDRRLPPEVVAGPQFEHWRRKAEARQPALLVMDTADLIAPGAKTPAPEEYPDWLVLGDASLPPGDAKAGGCRLALEYRLKPGEPDDGVTLVVPEDVLPRLDPAPFEWLVPGTLKDKVAALIKTLPKNLRVSLVPAPQVGERVASELKPVFAQGDLLEAVATKLSQIAGAAVFPENLNPAAVPDHLRMNFRVVDADDQTLGSGRDLYRLKRELALRAERAIASLPPGPYNRRGIALWDFGPLPDHVDVEHRATRVRAYPALVDETGEAPEISRPRAGGPTPTSHDTGVALRLFHTRERAAAAMRSGLRRLLLAQVRKEIRSLIEHTPGIERLILNHAILGPKDALFDSLSELIADLAFDLDDVDVRTKEEFEKRLDAGWDRLGDAGRRAIALAEDILAEHQRAATMLAAAPAHWTWIVADLRLQLSHLVGPGFLARTPMEWLRHAPRYLRGVQRRLEKAAQDGGLERDAKLASEFAPLWEQYLVRVADRRAKGLRTDEPALVHYRWMLEELRISLYAQDLRAIMTVSVQRLQKQWGRVLAEAGEVGAV